MVTKTISVDIRPYRQEDEPGVLELLNASLGWTPGMGRSAEFFRWKHRDNPFGPSFMLVAEAGERIVGLRAFMRWRFVVGSRTLEAVRAVDTATHPDFQDQGVFSRLTREALEALRGEADLVFNTPNNKSLPGYLKMGWRTVGKVPICVRIRHPLRFARGLRSLQGPAGPLFTPTLVHVETATEALKDADQVRRLLEEMEPPPHRLATPLNVDYLRWRYASAPHLDYRAVREYRGGLLCGLCIFAVRSRGGLRESTLAEVIVAHGDYPTARRLVRRAVKAAPVDHCTCHFPVGSEARRATRRCGFVGSPAGMALVVNPLRGDIHPDPADLGSWALSLGDLGLF